MTRFKEVKIPEGDLIEIKNGKLSIGDRPIIGYLRGDGIGLDITPAMQMVVDAAIEKAYGGKRSIAWCPLYAGLEGLQRYGSEFPEETVDAIRHLKIAIKGPFTTPIGEETHVCLHCAHQQYHAGTCDKCKKDDGVCERFRSINVRFRQHLDLYACVRPIRYIEGVPCPNKYADKVNFIIFRENTEDVYAGYDFEKGSDIAMAIIDLIKEKTGREIRPDSGIGIKPISLFGTTRLVRKAIQWAVDRKLSSVTIVHKGNIMKFTEGSFCKWGYELAAKEFGDCTLSEKTLWDELDGKMPAGKILIKDRIADSIFQQIQTRPDEYSVMALPNLNGDYLSDASIALVGGLGLGPGANMSDDIALFEATHGTAPKYTGMDKVNPGSLILSAVMMLEHMAWDEAARLIDKGMAAAIKNGVVTYDLARLMQQEGRKDVNEVSCSGFGRAIVERM
ncbi:MAG: NADP-dependent isocitrate dehydrogenase [Candidatus Eisenbacteria bacterium]|uniref:isocitrate dehydrogenase (NADP(+)) n=1 Tax=Eiseniibacteriota bacterium TaxID=2212470 RepID=A0A948W628_UNCEI|nr:NADP-dependent isocitrate dehydrogenase [Candidatus Eisenbacteria bacterium]MBU1948536.1 NADP-dependent isocitrate dehydrogenase [Candidatus Eisenbacteria bacterium]MBU2691074.1 NADP-dependent isocitrate dehydrogenase [Candidatus Eisenbacteria bacterium]